MSRGAKGPYRCKYSREPGCWVVVGPYSPEPLLAPIPCVEARELRNRLNAAHAAAAAPVPALLAVCQAFVAAYSESGEFNTHTAEHSPARLREMAKAAITNAKGGAA